MLERARHTQMPIGVAKLVGAGRQTVAARDASVTPAATISDAMPTIG